MKTAGVSGLGAVTCLGSDVERLWSAVMDSRSGIVDGLGRVDSAAVADLEPHLQKNLALAFAVKAGREALAEAGWKTEDLSKTGLILATTTGQFLEWDHPFRKFIDQGMSLTEFRGNFRHQPLGHLAEGVARELGLHGPMSVITSACTASTQALAMAAMWIRSGVVERCLVGGVEVLCDLTVHGFRSLQLLSNEPARPFDRNRKGINLSEGAAFLCVEAERSEWGSIAGFGFSTDGYHMTAPHPEGDGSYRAMSQALAKANVRVEEVDWIYAHGTGSAHNDWAEGLAIQRLCSSHRPWVNSTKWLHGHALGAAGALETVLLLKSWREGYVLGTPGLKEPDEKVNLNLSELPVRAPVRYAIKNTLGFGGTNAALVLAGGGR